MDERETKEYPILRINYMKKTKEVYNKLFMDPIDQKSRKKYYKHFNFIWYGFNMLLPELTLYCS